MKSESELRALAGPSAHSGCMDETKSWARMEVLRMLVRLVELIRRGEVLPDDPPPPWADTQPDVRRDDEGTE